MVISPLLVIFLLLVKRIDRCPNCKKSFAMDEVSRTLRDIHDSTARVDRMGYNSKTGLKEHYTEPVDAVVLTYDVVEKCRYCGYERPRVISEKEIRS